MNKYDLKNFKIMHYDLYRIEDESELDTFRYFLKTRDNLKNIEWPQLIDEKIKLEIHFRLIKNDIRDKFKGLAIWKI